MSDLPRLKVRWSGHVDRDIDLEQAKSFLPFEAYWIAIDGRMVYSYDELVQVASQDGVRDRDFLEVAVLIPAGGG